VAGVSGWAAAVSGGSAKASILRLRRQPAREAGRWLQGGA